MRRHGVVVRRAGGHRHRSGAPRWSPASSRRAPTAWSGTRASPGPAGSASKLGVRRRWRPWSPGCHRSGADLVVPVRWTTPWRRATPTTARSACRGSGPTLRGARDRADRRWRVLALAIGVTAGLRDAPHRRRDGAHPRDRRRRPDRDAGARAGAPVPPVNVTTTITSENLTGLHDERRPGDRSRPADPGARWPSTSPAPGSPRTGPWIPTVDHDRVPARPGPSTVRRIPGADRAPWRPASPGSPTRDTGSRSSYQPASRFWALQLAGDGPPAGPGRRCSPASASGGSGAT